MNGTVITQWHFHKSHQHAQVCNTSDEKCVYCYGIKIEKHNRTSSLPGSGGHLLYNRIRKWKCLTAWDKIYKNIYYSKERKTHESTLPYIISIFQRNISIQHYSLFCCFLVYDIFWLSKVIVKSFALYFITFLLIFWLLTLRLLRLIILFNQILYVLQYY